MIGSRVIFTPFPQRCGDKARESAGLFSQVSEPDTIWLLLMELQGHTLIMKLTHIPSQMEIWILFILFTGFTKFPTGHLYVFWYSAHLKDRWTENHRAKRPACLNTLQYSVLKRQDVCDQLKREGRHSIPSTISHSCASKYKLPLWHQIWTLSGWHLTSGWNMISCYFAQWTHVRDRHVELDLLK